ncbi:MAG: peroxidase [Planctomycetes bacterium]|nr:peroxidase [Planctomycetota bacterium]
MVEALQRGDLASAPVTDAERVLLSFVELLTRHAWRTTADDVERLRSAGWNDEQIAEAVYIAALFAFFNRVADAFGLKDPGYRQMPPHERPAGPGPQAASER